MKRGEITAFLSLIFILIVSFTGGMLDVTSIQLAKNTGRINMERALECVFAEYQKELLDKYDIFALEGSYETGNYSERLLLNRLDYYSGVNTDKTIERIQFLSDNEGTPFYEQVIQYMEHKYGVELVKDRVDMAEDWEKQEKDIDKYESDIMNNSTYLEEILSQNESELPEENNPIAYVGKLKQSSILPMVIPEDKAVSETVIDTESMVFQRERREGYGDFSVEEESVQGTAAKLLFGEYVLEHFHNVTDSQENVLDYEVEYILIGKDSDKENLAGVVDKLIKLRFVPNYTYLLSSPEKKAEAKSAALAMCAALSIPAVTEVVAQGILLAWAYAEAVVDVKTLLKGNKTPLFKDGSSWQLSLSGLMRLSEEEKINDGADLENGLNYGEYLRILLFLEKKEVITMRTLDLIELNLQKICGLDFLKVDDCVTRIGIESTCRLRRGITYTFTQYFGYN